MLKMLQIGNFKARFWRFLSNSFVGGVFSIALEALLQGKNSNYTNPVVSMFCRCQHLWSLVQLWGERPFGGCQPFSIGWCFRASTSGLLLWGKQAMVDFKTTSMFKGWLLFFSSIWYIMQLWKIRSLLSKFFVISRRNGVNYKVPLSFCSAFG